MWTTFWDMHSGGGQKLDWAMIYIEAPQAEAEIIFQSKFGRNPHRVTCTCCGSDYSIDESPTLEDATGYHRGCAHAYFRPDGSECPKEEGWKSGKGITEGYTEGYVERADTKSYAKEYVPLADYVKQEDVKVVYASEIGAEERQGSLRSEGYVWAD